MAEMPIYGINRSNLVILNRINKKGKHRIKHPCLKTFQILLNDDSKLTFALSSKRPSLLSNASIVENIEKSIFRKLLKSQVSYLEIYLTSVFNGS